MTLLLQSGLQDRASTRGRRIRSAGPGPLRNPLVCLGILLVAGIWAACSLPHAREEFSRFATLSDTLGGQLTAAYSQVAAAEWELRRRESARLARIQPRDLEPRVFGPLRFRSRSRIAAYLVNYAALLSSLAAGNADEDWGKQAEQVRRDLSDLQRRHPEWISALAAGVGTALVSLLPESLAAASRHRRVRRIMRVHHPVIRAVCRELAADLADCRLWVERCFARRFRLEVADSWPEKVSQRDRYAKAGMVLLRERRRVLDLLEEARAVLPGLEAAHAELMDRMHRPGLWPAALHLAAALERMQRCLDDCRRGR